MNRPDYLEKYHFNWDVFDVIVGGKSSLDINSYVGEIDNLDDVYKFVKGYGFDLADPVQSAELFGNFQEALQFIRRYFLKEGNPEGLHLLIPDKLSTIGNVADLFLLATRSPASGGTQTESLWAGIVLKVMHTILHADKDLRYGYFSAIQFQIFDRFYKYIHRDEENKLFLRSLDGSHKILLEDFQTKSKKSRDSIIIKLLHKAEIVADELFDRVGVRIITSQASDALGVLKFLYKNNVISVQNIKPSRSQNSLVDLEKYRTGYVNLEKKAIREKLSEEEFALECEKLALKCAPQKVAQTETNLHTSKEYRAIHFTCRQLIKYKNPFVSEFSEVRRLAKIDPNNDLAKKVLSLDTSSISRDVSFFYPFEVQITDIESHKMNTKGEASHEEYKKSQLHSAMKRIFKPLIEQLNLTVV
ncbi:MAG: TIGR04552 family protein [Bacteriovoracaceae bacterium]|nr:TIGR04552 family protein [Bacteriovoracaceae bacterium]